MNSLNCLNSATLTGKSSPILTPNAISGLTNWYESTTGLSYYAGNNYVYSWSDLSGNGRNLTTNVSYIANSPVYYSSGLNSFPSVGFTQNTWGQALYGTTSANSTEATFVAVVKSLASSKYQNIVSASVLSGASGNLPMLFIYNSNRYATGFVQGQGGVSYSGDILPTTDDACVLTCSFKRNTTNFPQSFAYKNYLGPNVATGGSNTLTAPFLTQNVIIGNFDLTPDGLGPRTLMGNIASVMIFNRFLSDSERIGLTNYLVSKWNISV